MRDRWKTAGKIHAELETVGNVTNWGAPGTAWGERTWEEFDPHFVPLNRPDGL